MAKLKTSVVLHIAKLADLKISKKERDKFREQLSEVISYVEELNEVDTKDVEPTSQTTGLENVKRVDETDAKSNLSQKEALSGTDKTRNDYFVVPAIFEEK